MITRKYNSTINPWLNNQIGVMENRPMVVPVYEGNRKTGYKTTDKTVQIFRLLAYGETKEMAEKMMNRIKRKQKLI